MSIFYGLASLISVILLIVYFFMDKGQNKIIMCLFISIAVCSTGYLILSLSKCLPLALVGNSIAYLGNVFLPFLMLMLVLDACNIKYSKLFNGILLGVGVVMLFFATTGGWLPIYYKSVTLEVLSGGSRLIKEYAPLHVIYFVYLFSYMFSMVAIIIWAIAKKRIKSKQLAVFLSVIVFGNIFVWLIEQFVEHQFEFLCYSYIINEILLLIMFGIYRDYESKLELVKEEAQNIPSNYNGNFSIKEIKTIFVKWKKVEKLTKREREILSHMLLGERRKEIAVNLLISESTVKNSITSILNKLEVENSNELYNVAKKYR